MTEQATPDVRGRRALTENVRDRFLELLANGWTVRAASKATGHNFGTFYELRREDEDFAAAWAEALEQGTQVLEQEAYRRAVEGYDEKTTDGDGNVLRVVRRYDSPLLQMLLKARRPESYRENLRGVIEHTGRVEVAHEAGLTLADMIRWSLAEANVQGLEEIEGELVDEQPALEAGDES